MELTDKILALEEGKCLSVRQCDYFALVALREGQYVVECGWVVPEAFDDDPGSYSYQPFNGDQAWVGMRHIATSPQDAADTYVQWRGKVASKQVVKDGEIKIGSVRR